MKPASCKAKGRNLQNWICERVREVFSLSQNDVKPAIMGESGIDIKLSDKARKEFPYAIEAKNVERLNVYQAWHQAITNAADEELIPMLIIKKNRETPLMIIDANYGFELLKNR